MVENLPLFWLFLTSEGFNCTVFYKCREGHLAHNFAKTSFILSSQDVKMIMFIMMRVLVMIMTLMPFYIDSNSKLVFKLGIVLTSVMCV